MLVLLLLSVLIYPSSCTETPWSTSVNGSEVLLYYPQVEDGTIPKFAFVEEDGTQHLCITYSVDTNKIKIDAEVDLDPCKLNI